MIRKIISFKIWSYHKRVRLIRQAAAMIDSTSRFLPSVLVVLLTVGLHLNCGQECLSPPAIDFPVQKIMCDQPLFFTILPKSEENMLIDNACSTIFPLPEDPNSFTNHVSYVYCDGSSYVESSVATLFGKGSYVAGNPTLTQKYTIIGYAGCDTYVGYICPLFGANFPPFVFGISFNCAPVGLSCLRKVEEIISNAGLPEQDLYILPMKLPNRCVNQRSCTIPPNPFYNKLGPSVGPL